MACRICNKLRAKAITFNETQSTSFDGMPSCSGGHSGVWDNMVLSIRAREVEFPKHESALSMKCVFKSREVFEVEGQQLAVHEGSFLILNHGRQYSSSIASDVEADTLTIFFRPDFVSQVLRTMISRSEELLDEPGAVFPHSVNFFEGLYSLEPTAQGILTRLRDYLHLGETERSSAWLEEQFCRLLEEMLRTQELVNEQIENLTCVRQSTRRELYRRLDRGRQFIDANLSDRISLTQIAAVACLSPNHFLRHFKQAYRCTPHQYLRRQRLEKARLLLVQTNRPITDICLAVGFESPSTFSWLFHRCLGSPPEKFRQANKKVFLKK